MKPSPILFLLLSLVPGAILARPVLADDLSQPHQTVSEAMVRLMSDIRYAHLLRQVAAKGWTYTAEEIASGEKRHFEEFELQLIDRGYEIIVGETEL